ncbi:MAG TPA: MarR family transcriptional regulator [Dongiaceae bacterium]|nr:MarR family transcriptional regulator [Dongiaceae bacterium]
MKQRPQMPPSDPAAEYRLEDQIGYWLRRAYQRHMAIFATAMSDLDLTSVQFAALVKLRDMKAVTQTELGRLIGIDRATISGVVSRLQKRGLLQFRLDPLDRRSRIIALTPAGEALLARALQRTERIGEDTLAPISEAEQAALREALRKLG